MAKTSDTPSPGQARAPQRRNEKARLAVLHAADDLLAERGFGGVTIEGIAARAGVAKQTIYRWWPSKVDVLLDTLVEDAETELAVPETGPAPVAARTYLRRLARFLTKEPAGRVLLALLGEAQHDAEVATVFRQRFLDPQRRAELAMLRRGIEAGELAPDLDPDVALDALTGPVFLRALTARKIPRAFVDRLVDDVLGADRR